MSAPVGDKATSTPSGTVLFALGLLTLFLELALIRYLAGNVWNLGYFPNLVLLAAFVGMGIGFLFHPLVSDRASLWLFQGAAFVLLGLTAFVLMAHPAVPGFSESQADFGGDLYFTSTPEAADSGFGLFAVWFLAVVTIFALVAQRTAKVFRCFAPLRAYTLDIGGSCCGILCFMLMSWLQVPAWGWFTVMAPIMIFALEPWRVKHAWLPALPLAAVVAIAHGQDQSLLANPSYEGDFVARWSPYQKIEFLAHPGGVPVVFANGIAHQSMFTPAKLPTSFYQVPYTERRKQGLPPCREVLVMGSGTGNDVAAALQNGAEHVDAVEIDPAIASIGRQHHPAQAYLDARVTLTVDDARAFMTRTRRRYDLVVFALTDSVVKVSSMAQLRLENYLFTQESVTRAASLLSDSGNIVLYNYYRTPWLVEKLEHMVWQATGRKPVVAWREKDFVVLMAGRTVGGVAPVAALPEGMEVPTDDWPFLYLKDRGVPAIYRTVLIAFAVIVLLLTFAVQFSRNRRQPLDSRDLLVKVAFLMMGISFLLLETKSIVQFSLLFGTTWVNSSLVFLAVLVLVLAANWTATLARGWRAAWVAYVLLIACCALSLAYPLANLLRIESGAVRFVVASLMTFSPLFFANLIFSLTFRDQSAPEQVFGWNLVGATLGGVVEYSSMSLGYNALAGVVMACYTACFVMLLVARRPRGAAAPS